MKYPTQFATITVNLSSITVGIAIAWSSNIVSALLDEKVDLSKNPLGRPVTVWEGSLIASIMTVGAFLGPFPAAFQAKKYGRKTAILTGCAIFILSFALLATTTTVYQIYAGRICQGLGVAYVTTVVTIYVGEIAPSHQRGALSALLQAFLSFGILFMNVVGGYCTYVIMNLVCLAFPIISALAFLLFPESPYRLIASNNEEAAIKSLLFFRNKTESAEIADELMDMTRAVKQQDREATRASARLFRVKGNRKALFNCLGLVFFQQFSGINAILFYTKIIFEKAESPNVDLSVSFVSLMMFLSACFVPVVADKAGRKTMLYISAIGMSLTNALVGIYFYLFEINVCMKQFRYAPIVLLTMYPVFFSLGFGPLPWVMLGEMLNDSIKFLASPIVSSTCWLLAFLISFFFPMVDHWVGASYCFWTFSVLCLLAALFTKVFVMETKGLSLWQIQRILNQWE